MSNLTSLKIYFWFISVNTCRIVIFQLISKSKTKTKKKKKISNAHKRNVLHLVYEIKRKSNNFKIIHQVYKCTHMYTCIHIEERVLQWHTSIKRHIDIQSGYRTHILISFHFFFFLLGFLSSGSCCCCWL